MEISIQINFMGLTGKLMWYTTSEPHLTLTVKM